MEEVKKMDEEEIITFLEQHLHRERTIKSIAELLNISEFEVLGYLHKLKEKGLNIDCFEHDNEVYLVKNDHPDLTKENIYRIQEDIDSSTKFALIADLRIGSKYEQIPILNDMYKKFLDDGVKYVIIAGNLLEGPYTGKDLMEFGKSLNFNDALSQANHLIEYFPKVEGIKTLFITGKNDHKWGKKMNVGEYIAKNRSDMYYLGPKSCNLYFNNVCFRVEQLKKGDAYTVAYPPQKYSRSMSSYEDYDAIFLGGALNIQHFPSIRDTQIFSIPSVVDRTPKMASDNQMNTMGALEFEITYTKNGKLKRLIPKIMPYYDPSKQSYLQTNKLNIVRSENDELVDIKEPIESNNYFKSIDRIYNAIKKEESFNNLKNRLSLTENELFGIISYLKHLGREIEIVEVNNELVVRKIIQKVSEYDMKPRIEELNRKEILVVSDTHYGSIWCQPSMVNTAVYEAYNRGITDIIHVGDICDGDYSKIRPNNVKEVFLYGATGQLDYVVKHLPKYKGMKWHVITGSHDQTHLFNYGMDFGKELEKRRSDVEYLGQDRAMFYLDKCAIEVFHPGGGTSRILSTKPQNGIDQIPSKNKPKISLRGHYHKVYYMMYRNIHTFLCPCNVDQSSFMMKNELPNLMGDYFLTIYYDDNGYVHYIVPEIMMFSQDDVRKNDFENPKRNIRNKILTKNIKP